MAQKAAKPKERDGEVEPTQRRGFWSDEISKGLKRWGIFHRKAQLVVDRYRLERDTEAQTDVWQDRYNILYSSTETTKPSLYAQTPKVEATKRHKDRNNDTVTNATMLLENAAQYALEEIDFDTTMGNVVMDYLLGGIGQVWVRYDAKFANDNEGSTDAYVASENVALDYVYFKDYITSVGRTWADLRWQARRVYFSKKAAIKRFGKEKAQELKYSYRPTDDASGERKTDEGGDWQAIIWEIWDKENLEVIWYSDDYAPDVLDVRPDILKLKNFWPCPKPLRAVWTTKTFIPKAFYSQYKAQAEQLDNITERIRWLTQALRVIGVHDASMPVLQQLLSGNNNKMVPVENWSQFSGQGGLAGVIQFVPIKEVAEVLRELYNQREIAKNEIYEITGFSDIVRGVSKASETLGAQKIKADWAGGRLKYMQRMVQEFCRDSIRLLSEIQAEHYSEASLALCAGFDPPEVTPEEQQAQAQYAAQMLQYNQLKSVSMTLAGVQVPPEPQKPPPTARQTAIKQFQEVVKLIRSEKERCALIGIETDSTIMPDEAAEREDRMAFLAAAGAFLQQAGPMAMQYPEMRPLLAGLMMFTIRTFRASRPLEKVFEETMQKMMAMPPAPPPGQEGQGGDNGEAAAQAQVQTEQMKQQGEQAKIQSESETKRYEIDTKASVEREKAQMEHQYRMAELQIKQQELALKERELAIKEAELGIKQQQANTQQQTADNQAALDSVQEAHRQEMDARGADRDDARFSADQDNADRQFEADAAAQDAATQKED